MADSDATRPQAAVLKKASGEEAAFDVAVILDKFREFVCRSGLPRLPTIAPPGTNDTIRALMSAGTPSGRGPHRGPTHQGTGQNIRHNLASTFKRASLDSRDTGVLLGSLADGDATRPRAAVLKKASGEEASFGIAVILDKFREFVCRPVAKGCRRRPGMPNDANVNIDKWRLCR